MLRQFRDWRLALFVALVVIVALAIWGLEVLIQPHRPTHKPPQFGATAPFAVSPTGTDFYYSTGYWNHASNWDWLREPYRATPSSGLSGQQQLASDAVFIARAHLGNFQRVWVCLDQLMIWNATTGYAGFNQTYLSNLDDALATFHANGIRVDLVLYEASKGSSDSYQFHTESLDGNHAQMRAGYLQALRDFVNHLAANPTDASTVAVMDLFNEAYYQLESFGLSDSVIHQWLQDEYDAAHGAAPGFPYTVSDTTRLLKDYATWNAMTPGDVIDEHLYDDDPGSSALYPGQNVSHVAFWSRTANFQRPWFSGEAGCSPGNVSCTYSGTNALPVDSWWLDHMYAYGAKAVLIEERNTAWGYPNGPTSQAPTLVGQKIQAVTQANPAPLPPSTVAPSGTAPVLSTPVPATATSTPFPATSTPLPPTATSVPAHTATPVPPLAPTATAVATSGHHRHRRH